MHVADAPAVPLDQAGAGERRLLEGLPVIRANTEKRVLCQTAPKS
jgi:hypothetical protein